MTTEYIYKIWDKRHREYVPNYNNGRTSWSRKADAERVIKKRVAPHNLVVHKFRLVLVEDD